MKISELISELEKIKEIEGDLPIFIDVDGLDEFLDIEEVIGKYHTMNHCDSKGNRIPRAFVCTSFDIKEYVNREIFIG